MWVMEADNAATRYQNLLGCGGIDLTNTTDLYARFTTTVICNAIVQNSISPCGLSSADSRPVCADTCVCTALLTRYTLGADTDIGRIR